MVLKPIHVIVIMVCFSFIGCKSPATKPKHSGLQNDFEAFALISLEEDQDCGKALYWKNKILDRIGSDGKMSQTEKYVINLVEDVCGQVEDRETAFNCGHQKNKKSRKDCLGTLLGGDGSSQIPIKVDDENKKDEKENFFFTLVKLIFMLPIAVILMVLSPN